MKLQVLQPDLTRVAPPNVLLLIADEPKWDYHRSMSLPGGAGPQVWVGALHGVMLLDPTWTRADARVLTRGWLGQLKLLEVEVPDVLAANIGIRPVSDPESPALLG